MRSLMTCLILFGALAGLTACGPARFDIPGPRPAEADYTALYPDYAEICAVSEIQKIPGFGAEIVSGGTGGHAVLFLNGACQDPGTAYPTLMLCPPGRNDGVGISANAHFRNANWVAIPGRDLFLHGGMPAGAPLTRAGYAGAIAQAERLGVYDGIEFHAEYFKDKPAGMSDRDFKYEVSIGTDFAVDFARGRYCARVPLSHAELQRAVAFLNARNAPYRDGKEVFHWNVLQDNCSHLTHNVLAAAGFWDEWPIERFVLISAFDFPVPKNEFVNQMRRANDAPMGLQALYDDEPTRASILRGDWLAQRPGALAEADPPRTPNDVYRTELRLIFYDDPNLGPYTGWFDRIFAEARYRDLDTNLRDFSARYRRLATERQPLEWWRTHHPSLASQADFAAFYTNFYAMLDRQTKQIEANLTAARVARASREAVTPTALPQPG